MNTTDYYKQEESSPCLLQNIIALLECMPYFSIQNIASMLGILDNSCDIITVLYYSTAYTTEQKGSSGLTSIINLPNLSVWKD